MNALLVTLLLCGSPVDPALVPGAPRLLVGHTGSVVALAFSADGKTLATSGFDRTVRVWDVAAGKLLLALTGPKESVESVAISPDGKLLAAGDGALAITLWSLPEGKVVRVMHNAEPIALVTFSPDGKLLAAGGMGGTGEVFSVADGKELFEVRTRTPAFSKDGKTIVGTSKAGSLLVIDAANGKVKKEAKGIAPASSVPTADCKLVYAWNAREKNVITLDGTTGAALAPLSDATLGISSVAISSDGSLLATASEDKTVRIYDLAKKAVVQKLPLEKIGFVTFSPDKSMIAVGDGAMVKLFKLSATP